MREDGRTENYSYDAAEQLTGANYGDTTSEGFNYDAMGNLSTRTNVAGGLDSFSVNNLNQYTAVNGNATSFDAKGNLLANSYLLSSNSYAYDAQNRLTGATRGTNSATFVYDGRNRCVQRTINGNTTTYVYDNWDLIAEYSGTTPIAEYIHGSEADEMLARVTAIGTVYYSGDALNSTAILTDSSGNVVERYRYTAFGQPSIFDTNSTLLTSSSYGNRFAFQGREWFAELNLTDHRNRYYSPELNRWLNRDSIAEDGGVNLYEYVENNPLNLTDHYGLYYDIVVGVPPPSSPYCLAACVVNGPDHGTSPNPAKLKSCVAKFKAEFRRIIATKGVGAGSQGACQLLDACYLLYGPSGPLY